MLANITPVLLTLNESANIERTLAALHWAERVIVLDSFSEDNTVELCKQYKNVEVSQRRFTQHAEQWNHAISLVTSTQWILTLDADHRVTESLVQELGELSPSHDNNAYEIRYRFALNGKTLTASLYPPMRVLFRRGTARFSQDGHTQRLRLNDSDSRVEQLRSFIIHDDRKSKSHWLAAQHKYAKLERAKLRQTPFLDLNWNDRIRKVPILAPLLVVPYTLIVKGLWRDGITGLIYIKQRFFAECILQRHLFG